jgi:hypothetical protein
LDGTKALPPERWQGFFVLEAESEEVKEWSVESKADSLQLTAYSQKGKDVDGAICGGRK